MARLSAFAGCPAVVPTHEGAIATPLDPLSVVSVTAWPGRAEALGDALRAALSVTLPEAGRWTHEGDLIAMWVGPDHWWLQRDAGGLLRDLSPVVGNEAALIDITDARAVLRVSGPTARDILASLLPIDLHPRALAPGRVASTVAAHIGVQIRQIDIVPSYDLSCLRSYAGSLWRALELAGAGRLRMNPVAEPAPKAVSPV